MPQKQGLYDPRFEHDACGVGFVVQMKGQRSHDIVEQALQILVNLEHRGAVGAEPNSGDGAGILVQLPHAFMAKVAASQGLTLPEPGAYGVAMVFVSPHEETRRASCDRFEAIVQEEGQHVLGWRSVPTNNGDLGATARSTEPAMLQAFIGRGDGVTDDLAFERKLYVIRRRSQLELRDTGKDSHWYPTSCSARTIVYKGMLTPPQVRDYFLDLQDPDLDSALGLVHSRFSTNTFPTWERSHPYRYVAHNGEINTLRGNINWMHARESLVQSDLFGDALDRMKPIINQDGSDSAIFDNTLELLTLSGRSLPHAVMMMIPEPWQEHESMSDELKAFYEYHACLMEPWDGPASIAFTDGTMMGAVLDRNGLRPSRYYVTADDRVIMASEAGVLPVAPDQVVKKGRLEPGRMFLVNMAEGRIVADEEIKQRIATEHPYRDWLNQHLVKLPDLVQQVQPSLAEPDAEAPSLVQRQKAFGYTFEELRLLLTPMAQNGVEAVGAMGTDTPLAALSERPKLLYDYFQQLFAQVTNPPIDSIREAIVTSPTTTIGSEHNLLDPQPHSCHLIQLPAPVLSNEELAALKQVNNNGFQSVTLPILFDPREGATGVAQSLAGLFAAADQAIESGVNIVILSDRNVDATHAPIPALLAVSGLHHHLIRQGRHVVHP